MAAGYKHCVLNFREAYDAQVLTPDFISGLHFLTLPYFAVSEPEDLLCVVVVAIVLSECSPYVDSVLGDLDFKLASFLFELAAEDIPHRSLLLIRVHEEYDGVVLALAHCDE